jgi:3-oxoadipate enol-lactonase/4-carboxymuconolactone decarboxylase
MTIPRIRGVELAGNDTFPMLIVGPSLGTTVSALWSGVADRLGESFHVIGFELPGHGSAAVGDPFTLAEVAQGVIAMAREVGKVRGDDDVSFVYAGNSVGGAVGLQLLLDAPSVVPAAVVLCTGARIGEPDGWRERAASVRKSGTASMIEASAKRWIAPGFAEREPGVASKLLYGLVDVDDEGYAQVCEALATFDVRDQLDDIDAPVLAVAGAFDIPTPAEGLAAIADAVPAGSLVVLDDVAHLAPAEAPAAVAALLLDHFTSIVARGERQTARHARTDPYDLGMQTRRAVLGDVHVDRATANADDLTRPFQELITRYAWGEVWGRDGLDRRSRSMLTVALLAALGHDDELAMHLRAAVGNGLSRQEIAETLLHTAIYAGVPAANSAFQTMQRVFAKLDEKP